MRTSILATELHRNTSLATALYVIGFACQVLGGVIALLGLIDDRRTVKRLPGVGAPADWIDRVPDAIRNRMVARRGWRVGGVMLIFVGAGVALAANLLALH